MDLSGEVLVFMADCEPMCALQVCIEILQAAAIESFARNGHFRSISQVTSTSSLWTTFVFSVGHAVIGPD